ncbi:MAG: hypothetical protein ACC742_01685 [Thermoanaerobaculales bacterium]
MRIDELLAIDVPSELRTLCEAQIQGVWQIPSELVRLGLRRGATEVSVENRRAGLLFRWQEAAVSETDLGWLETVLDSERSPEDRQRAIVGLEASGAQSLLWAGGVRGARLRLRSSTGERRLSFDHRQGRRLPRCSAAEESGAVGTVLEWSCSGLGRARAGTWLRSSTRFAPKKVLIDGKPIPRGFPDGLFHLQLESPVPCQLGLTRIGEDPLLWLLQDGVASARASVPGYPAFQAAVELGGIVPPAASAADLRRAVAPFLPELIDRAVWMMVRVADRLQRLPETDRQRLTVLLLQAALGDLRSEEVRRLPLVPQAGGNGRILSVEEVGERARLRGGSLFVIDAEVEPDEVVADFETAVRISDEERCLLTELLKVRLMAAPHRRRGVLSSAAGRLRAIVLVVRERLRGLARPGALAANQLRPQELVLLAALRSALEPMEVDFCGGGGGLRRTARGVLVPRSHPAVNVGAAVVEQDPFWLYPLLLALGFRDSPPPELRERWQREMAKLGVTEEETP